MMKITLNKYQKLMDTALELGNINVSGPACTGKTHFAAHWLAEKLEMYRGHPDGADIVMQVENLQRGMHGLLGAFFSAIQSDCRRYATQGKAYPYHQIGNVTVHLLRGDQQALLGPQQRPVFYVQDGCVEWGEGCLNLPTPHNYRGIRIVRSKFDDPEFCLDIEPVDGGNLPKHKEL